MANILGFSGPAKGRPSSINSKNTRPVAEKQRYSEVRSREHLHTHEIDAMIQATKKAGGRHAFRDAALILVMFRHGLRVGEAIALKWDAISFKKGTIHVTRLKNGSPSTHFLSGRVLRVLRELKRNSRSRLVFLSQMGGPLSPSLVRHIVQKAGRLAGLSFPCHPHQLRHSAGFYLANRGTDTRLIQSYLGHKQIQHTVRYTELAPNRFNGLWDD